MNVTQHFSIVLIFYHETWLSDSKFMKWIVWSVSEENAQDKICKFNFSLSKWERKQNIAIPLEKSLRTCLLEYYNLVYF